MISIFVKCTAENLMRIKININFIVNYFEESEIDPSGKKVCAEKRINLIHPQYSIINRILYVGVQGLYSKHF